MVEMFTVLAGNTPAQFVDAVFDSQQDCHKYLCDQTCERLNRLWVVRMYTDADRKSASMETAIKFIERVDVYLI